MAILPSSSNRRRLSRITRKRTRTLPRLYPLNYRRSRPLNCSSPSERSRTKTPKKIPHTKTKTIPYRTSTTAYDELNSGSCHFGNYTSYLTPPTKVVISKFITSFTCLRYKCNFCTCTSTGAHYRTLLMFFMFQNTTKIAVKYRMLLVLEKRPKKTEHLLARADALFNIYSILLITS